MIQDRRLIEAGLACIAVALICMAGLYASAL